MKHKSVFHYRCQQRGGRRCPPEGGFNNIFKVYLGLSQTLGSLKTLLKNNMKFNFLFWSNVPTNIKQH